MYISIYLDAGGDRYIIKIETEEKVVVDVKERKGKFWDKFKNNLIDLFKEEEDQVIK